MESLVFDAFEFSRLRARRSGEIAVGDLPRLADETVDRAGALQWAIEGGSDARGNLQLQLVVSGQVSLRCQRCLQPFEFDFVSDSTLVLARDETSADEIDAVLIDEDVEVVVGSTSFNALQVIEDEALLALPVSARHAVCPELPKALTPESVEKASPFAVLKQLKKAND